MEAAAKDSPCHYQPSLGPIQHADFYSSVRTCVCWVSSPWHTPAGWVRSLVELEVPAPSCCADTGTELPVITARRKLLSYFFFFLAGGWGLWACRGIVNLWGICGVVLQLQSSNRSFRVGCPPKHLTTDRQITCTNRASNVEGLNAWIVCGPKNLGWALLLTPGVS